MLNVDIISSRFIRIIGNIVKLVSKLFHKIFPKKRFTLSSYSKPLIKIKKNQMSLELFGKQTLLIK